MTHIEQARQLLDELHTERLDYGEYLILRSGLDEAVASAEQLADAAADRACPANGHIACDKFLNAGCKCPEAIDHDQRKRCWLEYSERVVAARAEIESAKRMAGEEV